MNQKKRIVIFQTIGIVFMFFSIFNVVFKYKTYGLLDESLWYCYILFFITGLLLYLDKAKYLSIIFAQALVLQTPWIIDSISFTLTHYTLFESSIFFYDGNFIDYIISLHHFILLPTLLLYFLYNPFTKRLKTQFIWGYSMLIIVIVITKIFTIPDSNINCLQKPCFFLFEYIQNTAFYYISFIFLILALQMLFAQILYKIIPFFQKHKKNTIFYTVVITIFFITSTTIAYMQTLI